MTPKATQDIPSQTLIEQVDPLRILAQLPLRPYQRLGDFRCGAGALAIPLAKHTFDGKVFATDEDAAGRERLQAKLTETRLSNTVVYAPEDEDSAISPDSLDGALVALALSATQRKAPRQSLLQRVAKALKRGGWAAIIEWTKTEAPEGPAQSHRLAESDIVALGKQCGFRFAEKRDLSSNYYMVLLRK